MICYLYVYFMISSINSLSLSCLNNRKILTNETGVIKLESLSDDENAHCDEWLIQGEIGKTITIEFLLFNTEFGFNLLFVFDGNSSLSKLIASMSGFQNGVSFTSTTNQMYLYFYSDSSAYGNGFLLNYTINSCPNNCSNNGTCSVGKCNCLESKNWISCQDKSCLKYCYKILGFNECDEKLLNCTCGNGFFGESCSIPYKINDGLNSWYTVSTGSSVFKPRSSHVAVYINNSLLVHGGFTSDGLSDQLLYYNFSWNQWAVVDVNDPKPAARYDHAGDKFAEEALVIFGGELVDGNFSNELWYFNTKWKLLSDSKMVPGLAGHTLTVVGWKIYIFGGRVFGDKISSAMYIYCYNSSTWKVIQPMKALQSRLRLVGHSANYYQEKNLIVVYGGLLYVSRNAQSIVSRDILVFDINFNTWIVWPDLSQNPSPALTFHSSVIAGSHLIVHGGWLSNAEYEPSNETYFYNLDCKSWTTYSLNNTLYTLKKRYLHTALMMNKQTILIVGGFNGAFLLNDIQAFKIPIEVLFLRTDGVWVTGFHCILYSQDKDKCLSDPSCIYCSTCLPNHQEKNCSDAILKPYQCRDQCTVLSTCEECTVYDYCNWCTLTSSCQYKESAVCFQEKTLWWGSSKGVLINTTSKCQVFDEPPGISYAYYLKPENFDYPDFVKILSDGKSIVYNVTSKATLVLKGRVYPFFRFSNADLTNHKILLRGKNINATLSLSDTSNASKLVEVVSLPFNDEYHEAAAVKNPIFLYDQNDRFQTQKLWYNLELKADLMKLGSDQYAAIEIQWNHTDNNYFALYPIPRSYLQPFETSNCSQYLTCSACVSDGYCGWCDNMLSCIPRSSWLICFNSSAEYLIRSQTQCFLCSHYFDCESCKKNSFCNWDDKISKCARKELVMSSSLECSSCINQSSIEDCLNKLTCVWCSKRKKCMLYSQVAVENKYGECLTVYYRYLAPLQNCTMLTSCSSCLKAFQCGWLYDLNDPRIGCCVNGDFSGPNDGDLQNVPVMIKSVSSWSYEICPDINECKLGIFLCVNNSICVNTLYSYECICNEGYIGDGKVECKKTCWHKCVQGICNETTYECQCNLGWTDSSCSVDCGCNGHSTCFSEVGICDQCQENTSGKHCEICEEGAYGNALTSVGCKKCECNGHGDAFQNYCSSTDGICFCLHNTVGNKCELCEPGFVGDPKDNGICYVPCKRSSIIYNSYSGLLSPFTNEFPFSDYTTCVWLISTRNFTHNEYIYSDPSQFNERILISLPHTNYPTSCFESQLTIYDGIPYNPRNQKDFLMSSFKNLGRVCGTNIEKVFQSSTGMLSLVYEGKHLTFKQDASNFLIKFKILKCPDYCPSPYVCSVLGVCACPDGFFGDSCEYAKCLNNCSENRNQGICILDAYCGCKAGFTGENCSQIVSSSLWQMSTLHIFSSAGNFLEDERFGGTLVNDQSFLYMFGGRDFRTLKSPDVFRINIVTGFREKLVFTGNIQPSGRYFHCSFLYKQNMYIYGGITTNYSLSKEIWKFSLLTNNWTDLTGNFEKNVKLAGHTCTLVGDIVYIIGGHDPIDGYSEFIRLIELNSLTEQYQKFTGLTPSALYGHIAVYYPAEKKIFVHGGMAFYNEKFQVSNQVYVFDPLNEYWNLMEPRPGNLPPFLFGHCGHMINRTLLIIGGYDNLNGFNNHIYKWRPECNQWFLVKKNATYFQKSRKTNVMFALSAAFNNSIFLYGGFNYNVNGKLTVFTPPRDICQRHRTKLDCLFEMGCSWCSSKVPFCFDLNTLSCGEDISFIVNGVACSVNAARDCSTYTSCGTCLSTYPKSSSCKWCLNSHCVSKLTSCLSYTEINQCGEYSCVAASCLNCGYNCIWTYNFEYTSEFIRTYGLNYPYNCFESSLLKSSSLTSTQVQGVKDSSKQCPRYCIEYTTCNDCLNVQVLGDFGGSTGCLWSEKLSACISYSLLPLKCSFGSCGQLYSKNMLNQCPISCELQYDCLSCIKLAHCGWCADDNKGTGRCLKGDVEGPATSICGQADYDNEGLLVINSNISAMNKTWAFMVCPLENECEFLKDPCHLNEACVDKEMGFECQCKPGYSRLLSNSSLSKCVPLCGDCGNGECISPDTCICNFGWTGKNCSVPCQCNGHSNCPNETDRSICLDCRNNTMGSTCEKCKPLYVGDPTAGGNCQDCRSICNFNTDVCMTNEEYEFLKNKNIDQILLSLSYGPKSISDVKCFGCQNNSEGDYCNSCIDGYFKLSNQACQPCQCNGHSDICDKNTGEDCQCSHNTEVSPTCKKDCFKEQCTHCKQSFSGDPVNGKQCYEKISTVLDPVLRTLASEKSSFFMASPSYTNVNMRLVIDVIYGELDVYLTDSDQYFVISENATTQSQNFSIIFGSEKRGRRSNEYITLPELVVSSDKFATFCEYSGSILLVKNLRKRLVIIIKYPIHDLSTKFFYLGLSTIKKPASAFFIYYRQDLPRLHLILFFLVLIVCLLIVMCFFILAWKARQLYLQGIVVGEQHLALKTMANRPIGSYKLLLCDNDELISKRKVEKSSLCNKVTPLATQDTEDSLASVITVMVQFPSNELAECCFCLGSGLTLAHNQQLLQIKTSLTGPQGRIVNTRILSTVA